MSRTQANYGGVSLEKLTGEEVLWSGSLATKDSYASQTLARVRQRQCSDVFKTNLQSGACKLAHGASKYLLSLLQPWTTSAGAASATVPVKNTKFHKTLDPQIT
jgi:hypothetical protein